MGLCGLHLMLQSAYFTRYLAYLGYIFAIGGWSTHFSNCLQYRKLFWWHQVRQWTARLYRKLLLGNCATIKEITDKKEAPKTIFNYLASQGLSFNLNTSQFSQFFKNQNTTEVTLLCNPKDHPST